MAPEYFAGVDTGGTFTDVVFLDLEGNIHFDKSFTTPSRPSLGVLAAVENCAAQLNGDVPGVLGTTDRFAHGTTVGTNALIQRTGTRVGLLMTRGFEDTLVIGRGPMARNMGIPLSEALDFIHTERAQPLVPKILTRGISERIALDGSELAPLCEQEVREALDYFRDQGVTSIAVCFLWSFKNGTHEERVKELIESRHPDLWVNLSSRISPLVGEFERATTTVVNAYIGPVLIRYIKDLQAKLTAKGLRQTVHLLKCSGGLALADSVDEEAVSSVNSGPVGGLVAARFFGGMLGLDKVITTDMGGTSFDVGLIYSGEFELERTPFVSQGVPIQVPAVKVVTIGAGGGSIASTDGRRLMVGPQSAGSMPGPACYAQGGKEPTVTDALVVTGILDPAYFFGGRKRLDPARAEAAIRDRIAVPLGLELHEAAAGIYEIVTAKMTDLVRKVTVESGFDPREFALFAYGGASPAHVAFYGAALGVREIIVPHAASVFSALGVAMADLLYSFARSEMLPLQRSPEAISRFNEIFAELRTRARRNLVSSGTDPEKASFVHRLDLRYEGQLDELCVRWDKPTLTEENFPTLQDVFEEAYTARFGGSAVRRESPLEIVTFRLEALCPAQKPRLARRPEQPGADPGVARKGQRLIITRALGRIAEDMADIYDFERLLPGVRVDGPAVIERRDTTIFVPRDFVAKLDGNLNVRLRGPAGSAAGRGGK